MIGMEDKFVLELGYELLSLVDRDNHPELLGRPISKSVL